MAILSFQYGVNPTSWNVCVKNAFSCAEQTHNTAVDWFIKCPHDGAVRRAKLINEFEKLRLPHVKILFFASTADFTRRKFGMLLISAGYRQRRNSVVDKSWNLYLIFVNVLINKPLLHIKAFAADEIQSLFFPHRCYPFIAIFTRLACIRGIRINKQVN